MAHITETEQYKTYLAALEALRQNGYLTESVAEKKDRVEHRIRHGSTGFGYLFTVVNPQAGVVGFLKAVSNNFDSIAGSHSAYSIYRERIKLEKAQFMRTAMKKLKREYDENKHSVKVYWPSDSLIGAVMIPDENYNSDDWLSIVKQIIG